MITRDVSGLEVITGFPLKNFMGCTLAAPANGFAPSVGYSSGPAPNTGLTYAWPGYMIDRQGLPRGYQSVKVQAGGSGVWVACSTGTWWAYFGMAIGLQHASATGGTWADYSTGSFAAERAAWYMATTSSTNDEFYNVRNPSGAKTGGYMTTSTNNNLLSDSISCGHLFANNSADFDLSQAKRYIRMLVAPRFESTGACGGPQINITGSLVFGNPDEAPAAPLSNLRVYVTSGCSTST